MEYLQYQLHVSAPTLTVIRLAFNLSRDYTNCMVYSGGGGARSRFTIVGSMKIRTIQRSDFHAADYCNTRSRRPPTSPPSAPYRLYSLLIS